MKSITTTLLLLFAIAFINADLQAQALQIPNTNTNFKCMAGRTIGTTDIVVKWNAPGVKGREGKIFGTNVAPFGMNVLGFGSDVESPWRAGANECTTISFSTPVKINGKDLAAGKYAFFIELNKASSTLIFNKNVEAWGSYFYDKSQDVLRVNSIPQTDIAESKERLEFTFSEQTDHSVVVALEWEHWKIPFTVEIDVKSETLASIKSQMSSGIGFNPQSLTTAAIWCMNNDANLDQALVWIDRATLPNLGGAETFQRMSTKAGILEKMGKKTEADGLMASALEIGNAFELHGYGRQLLRQKKVDEAMVIFKNNYKKHEGAWPTNVGLMRGYSAKGDIKKALEYAKIALGNAPDDLNRDNLKSAIKKFESGKTL